MEEVRQQMDRAFIRRHTAMELALDVLGRRGIGITGPNPDRVLQVATKIEAFLSGRSS